MEASNRAPNYAASSLGKMKLETLLSLYSRVLDFYCTNQRMPNYATVNPWISPAPSSGPVTSPGDLQQYLAATSNCQSNDPQIIALAQSITTNCASSYEMGLAIFNWVRDQLDYSWYYNTQKGAVNAMLTRTANCCDMSHLIVALCRAVNIPARYQHGTCNFNSGSYGHVWAELYVNDNWISADATSNANSFGIIKNWNTNNYIWKGTYAQLPF